MELSSLAQKIIVIHPGSQNVRIGRASDLNPITILQAVGRKRRVAKNTYNDTLLPKMHSGQLAEFEEHRLEVSRAIQLHITHDSVGGAKRLRIATPPQQIATFNRRCVPEVDEIMPETLGNIKQNGVNNGKKIAETIFDRDILKLTAEESAKYNIYFPMRRGELNLHGSVGGSVGSVLTDLEAIWTHGLGMLGIEPTHVNQYYAVLLIPEICNRCHVRELTTLLLRRLKFRSCFLLQEHVAATFGAGLSYACVVDVGDQKCSVSCVEDGISQPDTRVSVGYGGGDITQAFLAQLRKCCFPYRECDVEGSYSDAALLQQLKERFCNITPDVCGAQERSFLVHSQKKRLRYTIQLGDECIVAPLALFHTELLNITGKKVARTNLSVSQQTDPEDCFDAEYIRDTGRRNGRDQLEGTLPVTGDTAEDELVVVDALIDDRDANGKNIDKDEQLFTQNEQIVSLDQAIVRSIERCATDEMKRKMFGCILLVGGSSKFPGFAKWLEQKITAQLANSYQQRPMDYLPFEVSVFTKDMDATIVAWKGAAIMSMLESAPELWINANEWQKFGMRVLREKSLFAS